MSEECNGDKVLLRGPKDFTGLVISDYVNGDGKSISTDRDGLELPFDVFVERYLRPVFEQLKQERDAANS